MRENIPTDTSEIDEIDRRILKILQADASHSIETVAEKVHLSRNACWRRIRRLETDGIIRANVALVSPDAIGCPLSVFAIIRTNRHDPGWLSVFERAVKDMPEVVGAHRLSGDLDYVLRLRVGSVADYDAFYQRLIARVPIANISASFVMEDIKDTTALPV